METIALPTLSPRKPDSHKGDYGKVLVIAGSETMIGAPAIVGLAALRTGSGLVRIATPKEILPAVLTICPYATGFALGPRDTKSLLDFADQHDVLAVGPGLGTSPLVKKIITELLERHAGPMVLDADALNTLSSFTASEWPKRRNWGNVVLTPHMGEFMRLMGAVMKRGATPALAASGSVFSAVGDAAENAPEPARKTRSLVDDDDHPSTADGMVLEMAPPETDAESSATLQSADAQTATPPAAPAAPDNTALAELLAKATGCIVLLKGHRTVITDGHRCAINTTGNPAMATAGSGDVLTGVIASLIGQHFSPLDAAVLAAHVHGKAGDLARESIGPAGLLATDLVNHLPRALAARIRAE